MVKLTGLIVGSHFVPPAKVLLANLPAGTPVRLVPDPENPYDAGAIRVTLKGQDIPEESWSELEVALPGTGNSLDEVRAQSSVMLGHIAATGGKPLIKANQAMPGLVGNTRFAEHDLASAPGTLAFGPNGEALVVVEAQSDEEEK
jgi:hypothetical protein